MMRFDSKIMEAISHGMKSITHFSDTIRLPLPDFFHSPQKRFSFKPEEFIVEEICFDGNVLELDRHYGFVGEVDPNGKFCWFILQKNKWNTMQALNNLASLLHVSPKRFNFAGTKDRNAITVQLCSGFAVKPENVISAKLKDVKVNGAWLASRKVKLGDLIGNRFSITINEENYGMKPEVEKIREKAKKLNCLIPNYFGSQRFGSLRENSQIIGKLLLQGKNQEAVMELLMGIGVNEESGGKKARQRLRSEMDYSAALQYFPRHLKYERTIIAHLSKQPNDFLGAFRKLPRTLQLMFIHAFQSFIFNEVAKKRFEEGKLFTAMESDYYCLAGTKGFPELSEIRKVDSAEKVNSLISERKAFIVGNLVGSDSAPTPLEEQILEREWVSRESFSLKSLPELSSKGSMRPLFIPMQEFSATEKENGVQVKFELPAGSYATVALQELMK